MGLASNKHVWKAFDVIEKPHAALYLASFKSGSFKRAAGKEAPVPVLGIVNTSGAVADGTRMPRCRGDLGIGGDVIAADRPVLCDGDQTALTAGT